MYTTYANKEKELPEMHKLSCKCLIWSTSISVLKFNLLSIPKLEFCWSRYKFQYTVHILQLEYRITVCCMVAYRVITGWTRISFSQTPSTKRTHSSSASQLHVKHMECLAHWTQLQTAVAVYVTKYGQIFYWWNSTCMFHFVRGVGAHLFPQAWL